MSSFNELGISEGFIAALAKQKIVEPTPIQLQAIPAIADGRDVVLNSETGSGKTLAYLLPLMARLDVKQDKTQLVVLAPTHELAIQIQRQACDLAQHAQMPARVLLLIGGTSLDRQLEKLKKKPHVVVGSPGRVGDLLAMGKLKPQAIRTLVLDEVDTLLGGENAEAVSKIVSATPQGRQLLFVSASDPEGCAERVSQWAPQHVVIRAGAAPVNERIEHLYLICEQRDKPDVLRRLVHAMGPERGLAFVHRNHRAEEVAAKLAFHQIPTTDLHGAFDKEDRKRAMEDFRKGRVRILIASDVAARGLDIPGVTHVFNLDAPSDSQAYLHRVGRTARAGAEGTAVSLFTEQETRLVRRYEQELGIRLQRVRLREGRVLPVNPEGEASFPRR
jgi:superfamily II DNA/RNA helicase